MPGECYPHAYGVGQADGELTFSDNAANSLQPLPLSGTGVEPATLAPAGATYAPQTAGTTSAAKTFTLTNDQTGALTSIAIFDDRRYCGFGDDVHDEFGGQGQMHDQRDVHADSNRDEDGAVERERQRQQQPADGEFKRHGQVKLVHCSQPAPQKCGALLSHADVDAR